MLKSDCCPVCGYKFNTCQCHFDAAAGSTKLKSVKLIEEKLPHKCRRFYLEVTYTYSDKYMNEHEVIFHKVELPICENLLPKVATISETIDLGFGDLPLQCNSDNIFATDHITKYYCKEMTIEEIESKLGHKIKIINKKGGNDETSQTI